MLRFDFFKQITEQADSWKTITPLLAVIVTLLGIILVNIVLPWLNHRQQRLKQKRHREIPSGDFPFEIIQPNSNSVLEQLMPGSNRNGPLADEKDPLADANIPYLQRQPDRNVRQELERAFEEKPWVLILGRTGLGKTREATQLAKVLNDEGWTILNLADKSEEWLDEPRKFPSELHPNSKLLFFLDDLNRWVHPGNPREIPKDADDPAQPLRVPVQERLLRTIAFFERECRNEVRVIATARNESDRHPDRPHELSEIEKLQLDKYSDFWKRFRQYELEAPSDEAIVQLLSDRVTAAHLRAKTEEFSQIARKNDGTFRNIVENLRTAKNQESVVSIEGLSETLDRTWRLRYNNAVKRYRESQYVYDAIEVLRIMNLRLIPLQVLATAELFIRQRGIKRISKMIGLCSALGFLIESEKILKPRDGQIEAKGHQVDVEQYIPLALKRLASVGKTTYPQVFLVSEFFNCGYALRELKRYEDANTSFNEILKCKPRDCDTWWYRGMAFAALERYEEAITSFDKAIKYKSDDHYAWYFRGMALAALERYEEAIASFDEAIKHKSDYHQAWNSRGNALIKLNCYDEAIASYDQAVSHKPNYHVAWFNKARCYALQNNVELAIENLRTSFILNAEQRQRAKINSAFDIIRSDDRFQALINEHQNE
ncbi:tetratricopeptide repeat protein [Leptolyngbya sp. NIES-2104]|uniref:tetratricopeptide repeat protein n=1 Tax=Leptolyngbya sp. NIES-2104 TaxID=1552121 RepID=UPI0006EC8B92|nr:tetratricopeptide repeat protein [Leptolyngbya sp. NIES-2104]GAP94414.1 TPR domain protein, putative component of TonB system [Leptolyngbya sp. NIES-2104]